VKRAFLTGVVLLSVVSGCAGTPKQTKASVAFGDIPAPKGFMLLQGGEQNRPISVANYVGVIPPETVHAFLERFSKSISRHGWTVSLHADAKSLKWPSFTHGFLKLIKGKKQGAELWIELRTGSQWNKKPGCSVAVYRLNYAALKKSRK